METRSNHRVRFRSFELDLTTRELRKNGQKLKLQGQPVEVLTMLLERPGEVVTREDIQRRLWPEDTFVDFEHSLNSTVRRLRDALGDNAENPRFIETLPRLGYRFIASVDLNGNGLVDHATSANGSGSLVLHSAAPEPQVSLNQADKSANESLPAAASQASLPRHKLWVSVGAISAVAVAIASWWLSSPHSQPRVTNIVQITNDGLKKGPFVTEGSRLYYSALVANELRFFQVSTQGGEPVPMHQLDGMYPVDISGDHSEVLLVRGKDSTLWVASVLGGSPRRLGDVITREACWSPKGDQILYPAGHEVRIAHSDGVLSKTLVRSEEGGPYGVRWSPDGQTIRFSVWTEDGASIWEVSADGTGLHRLFPHWTDLTQYNGTWSPDQKYFVFVAAQHQPGSRPDLWELPKGRRVSQSGSSAPIRLTNGPLNINFPVFSSDSKRIFFFGELDRGELVRYDRKTEQWLPYLSGLSATQVDFSPDGKWTAYVSYPETSIWRSALDGSQNLQLTPPPLQGGNPRWSTDGTQIAFAASRPNEGGRVYVESATGVGLRKLTNGECGRDGESDPVWSPDGASILFSCTPAGPKAGLTRENVVLRTIDLQSGRIAVLPGSQGLWSPRWSPDGRFIAAFSFPDPPKLMLYDLETHAQREMYASKGGLSWEAWSRDGQFLYFEESNEEYRLRIRDHKVERFADLTAAGLSNWIGHSWVGVTPDGSLLGTRQAGNLEIYALEWDAP